MGAGPGSEGKSGGRLNYLRVRNWDKFQQYKDRGPKWIKLYRDLIRNYSWTSLDDASRGHLISIWLLAAELGNKIPYDAAWIAKQISAFKKIDLKQLVTAGFLDPYETVQNCTDDKEQPYETVPRERVEKSREEEIREETEFRATQDSFSEFWEAYPRKVGRAAAARVWKKLNPDADLAALIVAAVHRQRTCRDWLRDGGQFIPHPTTWLNAGRWDDEVRDERESQVIEIEQARRIAFGGNS